MPSPRVHVLDVGDGACTVLRSWDDGDQGPRVIVDGGTWLGDNTAVAEQLLEAMDGTSRESSADNWFIRSRCASVLEAVSGIAAVGAANCSSWLVPSSRTRLPGQVRPRGHALAPTCVQTGHDVGDA